MGRHVKITWNNPDEIVHRPVIRQIRDAAATSAREVEGAASSAIHSRSGRLAASGEVLTFEKSRSAGAYVRFGNDSVDYAFHVEAGTFNTKEVSYLRRAFARSKSLFIKSLRAMPGSSMR